MGALSFKAQIGLDPGCTPGEFSGEEGSGKLSNALLLVFILRACPQQWAGRLSEWRVIGRGPVDGSSCPSSGIEGCGKPSNNSPPPLALHFGSENPLVEAFLTNLHWLKAVETSRQLPHTKEVPVAHPRHSLPRAPGRLALILCHSYVWSLLVSLLCDPQVRGVFQWQSWNSRMPWNFHFPTFTSSSEKSFLLIFFSIVSLESCPLLLLLYWHCWQFLFYRFLYF